MKNHTRKKKTTVIIHFTETGLSRNSSMINTTGVNFIDVAKAMHKVEITIRFVVRAMSSNRKTNEAILPRSIAKIIGYEKTTKKITDRLFFFRIETRAIRNKIMEYSKRRNTYLFPMSEIRLAAMK